MRGAARTRPLRWASGTTQARSALALVPALRFPVQAPWSIRRRQRCARTRSHGGTPQHTSKTICCGHGSNISSEIPHSIRTNEVYFTLSSGCPFISQRAKSRRNENAKGKPQKARHPKILKGRFVSPPPAPGCHEGRVLAIPLVRFSPPPSPLLGKLFRHVGPRVTASPSLPPLRLFSLFLP